MKTACSAAEEIASSCLLGFSFHLDELLESSS